MKDNKNDLTIKIDYLADHPEFIGEISLLFHKEWSHLIPGRSLSDLESLITQRCQKARLPLALVAVKDKQWLGSVSLKESDLETRKDLTPWLAGLYVKEEFRGKGIAKLLISDLLKKAKELNISQLHLFTETAENYYSALGWELIERSEDYHGNRVSVMKKNLLF